VLRLSADQLNGAPAGDIATLTKLRQEYGYVVIAAGPMKDAVGLFAIGDAVCCTFFVVEPGKSRRDSARYALDLLRQLGFSSIKLIINKHVSYLPEWMMKRA
jgi:Mrp family chromosome partitioning ATPase